MGALKVLPEGNGAVLPHGELRPGGNCPPLIEGQVHRVVGKHLQALRVQQEIAYPVLEEPGEHGVQGPGVHHIGGIPGHQGRHGVIGQREAVPIQRRPVTGSQRDHRVGARLIYILRPLAQSRPGHQAGKGNLIPPAVHRLIEQDGVLTLEGLGQQGIPGVLRHLGRGEQIGGGRYRHHQQGGHRREHGGLSQMLDLHG